MHRLFNYVACMNTDTHSHTFLVSQICLITMHVTKHAEDSSWSAQISQEWVLSNQLSFLLLKGDQFSGRGGIKGAVWYFVVLLPVAFSNSNWGRIISMKLLQDQCRTVWKALRSVDSLLKWDVSSEFLQGFAPGLALFSACINDLDDGIQNIIKFRDCTCLRSVEVL